MWQSIGVRLDHEKRVRALFASFPRIFAILLRNRFNRREIAYSDVESAAVVLGCVVHDGISETKTPEIDFVKLSALTIATLAAERIRMSPNGQIVPGGAILPELSFPKHWSAISRDSTPRCSTV